MWKGYSRSVVRLVVLIARGWGVSNQELFQVPFERKWKALSNHPKKKLLEEWECSGSAPVVLREWIMAVVRRSSGSGA